MNFTSKRPLLAFLLFSIFHVDGFSQTFQKTYGSVGDDQANHVLRASDGGYLIAGSATPAGSQQPDAYLLKIDEDGEMLWQRSYGGSAKDIFMKVIEANGGGYLVAGETWSFGQGQQDLFVMRVDLDGNVMWCKTFGGSVNDYARGLVRLSDGYLLSGPQYSIGQGGLDAYFIRLDNNGNVLYSKTLGTGAEEQIQVGYVEGNIMYAGGGASGRACYATLNLQTCEVISLTSYDGNSTEALYNLLPTIDSNFIMADHTWSSTGGSEIRQ